MFAKQYIIFLIVMTFGSAHNLWCMENTERFLKQAKELGCYDEINKSIRSTVLKQFMKYTKIFLISDDSNNNTVEYWEPLHTKDLTKHSLYKKLNSLDTSHSQKCCYLKDTVFDSKKDGNIRKWWSENREILAALFLLKISRSFDDNQIFVQHLSHAIKLNDGYFIYYISNICNINITLFHDYNHFIAPAQTMEMIKLWDFLFQLNDISVNLILKWNLSNNTPSGFLKKFLKYTNLKGNRLSDMLGFYYWAKSPVIKNLEQEDTKGIKGDCYHKSKLILLYKFGCKDTSDCGLKELQEKIIFYDSEAKKDIFTEEYRVRMLQYKKNYEWALGMLKGCKVWAKN